MRDITLTRLPCSISCLLMHPHVPQERVEDIDYDAFLVEDVYEAAIVNEDSNVSSWSSRDANDTDNEESIETGVAP